MRRLFERIPEKIRLPALTVIYGICGGLTTVAFMLSVNKSFALIWHELMSLGTIGFLAGSFAVIVVTSTLSGILMSTVCPSAAGSGIPQLKAAYWTELGNIPFRAVFVKFIGGVLALAGGASLGREGPTVFIAGGLSSNLAGFLGIDRKRRRHATAAGAAAGLAAAFNTPLAAISFVLEEILGDLNNRLMGSVMLASVTAAFIVYALVGKQPSFSMPSVDAPSWDMYTVVPLAAALSAVLGVVFQRATLKLRVKAREERRVPAWARPAIGGVATWLIGCSVYLVAGKIGVFGLGYADLSDALVHGIGWKLAGLLALAKLAATIASYGSGGCGGIFSPTLFIGAMSGFFVAGIAKHWIPLTAADELVLAATGMSACFGAVVRAPVTGILMIFEMTHQFGMVPALMLGSLVSQAIARLAGKSNFYDEVLVQDGHPVHKIAPPRDLSAWRNMPVATLTNRKPVAITAMSSEHLSAILKQHPYRVFPVMIDGALRGVVSRPNIEHALAQKREPSLEKAVVCRADQTLQQVEPHMIESASGLFLVTETEGGPVIGLFTLHDLLRAQAALLD